MTQESQAGPDTSQLLRLADAGDDDAVNQLVERYQERLLHIVAAHLDHRLAARIDPADVVQETLAEAARRLPEYAHEPHVPFYAWLRRIAHDRLIDLRRRHYAKKRNVRREQLGPWVPSGNTEQSHPDPLTAPGSSPSEHVRKEEARACVRAILDRLSTNDREVLVMRYDEQLSIRDIAYVLGVSEEACKKRHFRAIHHFRKLMTVEVEGMES